MIKKDANDTNHIIFKYSKQSIEEVLTKFKTTENGYSELKANKLLNKYGPNQIEVINEKNGIKLLLNHFLIHLILFYLLL